MPSNASRRMRSNRGFGRSHRLGAGPANDAQHVLMCSCERWSTHAIPNAAVEWCVKARTRGACSRSRRTIIIFERGALPDHVLRHARCGALCSSSKGFCGRQTIVVLHSSVTS